jgi:hypothetical protein
MQSAVGQNATGCADRGRFISIVTEIADVFAAPDWTTLPTMRRSGRDAAGFLQPNILHAKALRTVHIRGLERLGVDLGDLG